MVRCRETYTIFIMHTYNYGQVCIYFSSILLHYSSVFRVYCAVVYNNKNLRLKAKQFALSNGRKKANGVDERDFQVKISWLTFRIYFLHRQRMIKFWIKNSMVLHWLVFIKTLSQSSLIHSQLKVKIDFAVDDWILSKNQIAENLWINNNWGINKRWKWERKNNENIGRQRNSDGMSFEMLNEFNLFKFIKSSKFVQHVNNFLSSVSTAANSWSATATFPRW